jgi:hypothetical protein
MIDPKKRRLAIARILAGDSKPEDEAKNLQISARQVRSYVAAARAASRAVPPLEAEKPPSENIIPPQPDAVRKPNPALDEALKAAGEPGAPTKDVPPTPTEVVDGRLEMQKFCLETVGNIKSTVGSTMVSFRYSPPLLLSDPAVQKLLDLSRMEHGIIVANAPTLYPILMRWMSGPYQLLGGLVVGQFLMMIGLDNLAKNKGWKDNAAPAVFKAAAAAAPPPPPSPRATAPAFVPPTDGITAENREAGPFGKISDAPSVKSEFILPADAA